jgi:peptidoglycan endopeptidase LytF
VKKAWAISLIAVLHVVVVGSLLIQGCGTTRPAAPTEPPMVMPPVTEAPVLPPVVEPPKVELPPVEVPKKVYTVKAGDSLSLIAQRFNVSTRDIIKMNKISNPNKVVVGAKLTLPGYVDLNAKEPVRKPRKVSVVKAVKKSAPVVAGAGEYVVKSGDTLGHIAVKNGTTSKAIKQLNNLTSDALRVGQKLALPKGGEAVAPAGEGVPAGEAPAMAEAPAVAANAAVLEAKPGELLHVVEPNQQLDAIAMIYGVRVEELISLNNLASPDVKAGQTLKIPPPVE